MYTYSRNLKFITYAVYINDYHIVFKGLEKKFAGTVLEEIVEATNGQEPQES